MEGSLRWAAWFEYWKIRIGRLIGVTARGDKCPYRDKALAIFPSQVTTR
jgi:hypothetical protein